MLTNVVRFPRECPKCGAVTAMPSRAGTLAEHRTQVDVQCSRCRYEWSLEMTPPVLIVKPEREADSDSSSGDSQTDTEAQAADRRHPSELRHQRMRVGLRGLLTSTDRTHTITVLYSLAPHGRTGRLRLIDPDSPCPSWLVAGSRLWLSGYDGVPLRIRVTTVKLPREDRNEDDHFAEFVVPQAAV